MKKFNYLILIVLTVSLTSCLDDEFEKEDNYKKSSIESLSFKPSDIDSTKVILQLTSSENDSSKWKRESIPMPVDNDSTKRDQKSISTDSDFIRSNSNLSSDNFDEFIKNDIK